MLDGEPPAPQPATPVNPPASPVAEVSDAPKALPPSREHSATVLWAVAALVDAMRPMRGLPLLAALAGGAARNVALPYWPPQGLWLDVAPA